jgi:hypothetical protein
MVFDGEKVVRIVSNSDIIQKYDTVVRGKNSSKVEGAS